MNILRDIFNLINEGSYTDIVKANLHDYGEAGSSTHAANKYARRRLKSHGKDMSKEDEEELVTKRAKNGAVGRYVGGAVGSLGGLAAGGLAGAIAGRGRDESIALGASLGSLAGNVAGGKFGRYIGRSHAQKKFIKSKLNKNEEDD